MKSIFHLIVLLAIIAMARIDVAAQYAVSNHQDGLKATVDMAQFHDPFAFNIKYAEAPHPTGKDAMRAFYAPEKTRSTAPSATSAR